LSSDLLPSPSNRLARDPLEEGYSPHVNPYCLWGVVNKIMGSSDMHKLYYAQALAYHSEHLHPDPAWIWITQEFHIQIPTSSSHLIWKYSCLLSENSNHPHRVLNFT